VRRLDKRKVTGGSKEGGVAQMRKNARGKGGGNYCRQRMEDVNR